MSHYRLAVKSVFRYTKSDSNSECPMQERWVPPNIVLHQKNASKRGKENRNDYYGWRKGPGL